MLASFLGGKLRAGKGPCPQKSFKQRRIRILGLKPCSCKAASGRSLRLMCEPVGIRTKTKESSQAVSEQSARATLQKVQAHVFTSAIVSAFLQSLLLPARSQDLQVLRSAWELLKGPSPLPLPPTLMTQAPSTQDAPATQESSSLWPHFRKPSQANRSDLQLNHPSPSRLSVILCVRS